MLFIKSSCLSAYLLHGLLAGCVGLSVLKLLLHCRMDFNQNRHPTSCGSLVASLTHNWSRDVLGLADTSSSLGQSQAGLLLFRHQ